MQGRKNLLLLAIITVLLYVGLPGILYAHDSNHDTQHHNFEIVATDESELTHRIVADLQKRIPSAQLLTDPAKYHAEGKRPIYITIGPSALRLLLAQKYDGIIISVFTSSEAYRAILESADELHAGTITAIYAEPAPSIQFNIISMLYKRPTGVAAILSNKTAYLEPILRNAAAQTNTQLTVEKSVESENLNRILSRIADIPVILATPDNTVYNPNSIRNILMTAYGRNQSVIGFSAALVKAGALASSYSDIEDIDAQVDELITDFETSGKLAEPQFPRYFSVAVNDAVARSLNIVVDDTVRKFSRKPAGRQP